METRQWPAAESALLEYLWNRPSGMEGASACESFARVCVMVHKAPIAMEWLEIAIDNPDIDEIWKSQASKPFENTSPDLSTGPGIPAGSVRSGSTALKWRVPGI